MDTAPDPMAEIEALLRADDLIGKGADLDLVRDVRNALCDRRVFLQQRDQNMNARRTLDELFLHGMFHPMDASTEHVVEAYKDVCYRMNKAINEARVLRAKVQLFRQAWNNLVEE